jgi:hypothetical protein
MATRARVKEDPPMQKTALRFPEPLWRALKFRAIDEHTTLQQLVIDAVTAFLKTPSVPKGKPPKKATSA